jgi:hypothetical protein
MEMQIKSMRFHITQSEWLSPNYNTIIHNSQAMGTAKMLHNWWLKLEKRLDQKEVT